MTIEEKRKAVADFCNIQTDCETCPENENKDGYCAEWSATTCPDDVLNAWYNHLFPVKEEECKILDSGERREFESGAVRDIQEGKGRCDLMPLDVVAEVLRDPILKNISDFQTTGDCKHLIQAIYDFSYVKETSIWNLMLEVSKHFEEGAKKYGENNWQKGIPVHCYIDSAVRHYMKWIRGDKDEPHDRAFVWNILCCIWTVEHGKGAEEKPAEPVELKDLSPAAQKLYNKVLYEIEH